MGVTKPLTLLLTGLCVVSWCLAQHHFVLFPTPKTWYEARSHCREVCYDLATVDDMREMQTLLNLTEGRYDEAIWIGLHKANSYAWHWSLPDKDLYKEGERTYADITGNSFNCVSYKNGVMRSVGCNLQIQSVCFDAKKEGQQQYALSPVLTSWPVARDHCRIHHTDLASVRKAAEEQIIQNMTLGSKVYIGAFRDPWEWSDGTYSSMRFWKPSQPTHSIAGVESCVAMLKSEYGKWGERSCVKELPFLCNCPMPKFISKVKVIFKSSGLDLNDPAVQADLLKQIDKQLNQKVALRWTKQPDGSALLKMSP